MWKRCPMCGKIFNAARKDHKYCSKKCRRMNQTLISTANVGVDYAVGMSIYDKEDEIKNAPTFAEVRDTINILKDFGVKEPEELPEFHSRYDMSLWRRRLINTALA